MKVEFDHFLRHLNRHFDSQPTRWLRWAAHSFKYQQERRRRPSKKFRSDAVLESEEVTCKILHYIENDHGLELDDTHILLDRVEQQDSLSAPTIYITAETTATRPDFALQIDTRRREDGSMCVRSSAEWSHELIAARTGLNLKPADVPINYLRCSYEGSITLEKLKTDLASCLANCSTRAEHLIRQGIEDASGDAGPD